MSGQLSHQQLMAFTDCVDAGEKAATGDGLSAVVILAAMLQREPVVGFQVLVSILAGVLKSHALVLDQDIPTVAQDLRARGAL